jgi:hypothetical protein
MVDGTILEPPSVVALYTLVHAHPSLLRTADSISRPQAKRRGKLRAGWIQRNDRQRIRRSLAEDPIASSAPCTQQRPNNSFKPNAGVGRICSQPFPTGGSPIHTLRVIETMGAVGALALAANSVCFALLWRQRAEDINMRSVWLCSRNDLIANVSVLFAALAVLFEVTANAH